MANRGKQHIWIDSYQADAAITQYGWVIRSTGAHECKLPTAVGQQCLGVALEGAADNEYSNLLILGRDRIIDKAGSLNNGDKLANAGTANYHQTVLASGSDMVGGVLDGEDGAAAADLLYARVMPIGLVL
mgnify:CR=1 FL=1